MMNNIRGKITEWKPADKQKNLNGAMDPPKFFSSSSDSLAILSANGVSPTRNGEVLTTYSYFYLFIFFE